MPDSSEVDAALSAKLLSDTGPGSLTTLMPDGVWFDIAKKGATKFVIVSQLAHEDTYMFQGSAWERFIYLVKAVALSTTGADVKTAAARIHTLLQQTPSNPTPLGVINGYTSMNVQRLERIRFTEVDENNDQRWQHRGGQYEVLVSPT